MIELTRDEKELLLECIQYRLGNDKIAKGNNNLREDLEDVLFKIEEFE
jgi:hypothetical protein